MRSAFADILVPLDFMYTELGRPGDIFVVAGDRAIYLINNSSTIQGHSTAP